MVVVVVERFFGVGDGFGGEEQGCGCGFRFGK